MNTKNDDKIVLSTIEKALEQKEGSLTLQSNISNTDNWDSLSQLNILIKLDEKFEGKVGRLREMASADSVEKILVILKKNDLI